MTTDELLDDLISKSMSQIKQDVFVLHQLDFKRNGYFVEFGAASGVGLSNTYMLEKEMGWTGILAEPAKFWHELLKMNRSDCHLEFDCVWSKTGEALLFNESDKAELSAINGFASKDEHAKDRDENNQYEVKTISLLDLLKKYDAPKEIDYLSIDTEGSEFEILNAFDFDAYKIKVITCEHNHTSMRDKIYELLSSKGYVRKCTEVSFFDDWYVLTSK